VQKAAPKCKVLHRDRVRLEIAGGNYRLIAAFDFRRQVTYVKFIGTESTRLRYRNSEGLTAMDIRPIRNDEDHRAALAEIDRFCDAAEGTAEGDRLDVLLALVEIYEAKRWPISSGERSDPIDVLHYALEELGHTQAELAEILGSRSRASEILSRRRPLTVDMIHRIGEAWKIPADLLVRPYKLERAA
jgi:HTH-type transcriptional regulator/antitoxin HigA